MSTPIRSSESAQSLTVSVADPAFGIHDTQHAMLCIEIDEFRFRFCAVQKDSLRVRWLEDYASDVFLDEESLLDRIRKITATHPFFSSNDWQQVRVAVNSSFFTHVPASLFRKEYIPDYLRLVMGHAPSPAETLLQHELPAIEAQSVFTIPTSWYDFLLEVFPLIQVDFYHVTGPLVVGALMSQGEIQADSIASIYVEEGFVTVIVTEKNKLLFCNRFAVQNTQELSYLVLFSLNQLGLMLESVTMVLYGEVTAFSEAYQELSKFVPKLIFGNRPAKLSYINEFEDILDHRYFALFNIALL